MTARCFPNKSRTINSDCLMFLYISAAAAAVLLGVLLVYLKITKVA
jgi:hypothetical protein